MAHDNEFTLTRKGRTMKRVVEGQMVDTDKIIMMAIYQGPEWFCEDGDQVTETVYRARNGTDLAIYYLAKQKGDKSTLEMLYGMGAVYSWLQNHHFEIDDEMWEVLKADKEEEDNLPAEEPEDEAHERTL